MHRITRINRGESAAPRPSTPAVLVAEDAPIYRRLIEGHLQQWASILCAPGIESRHGASLEVQISYDWHCLTGFCPRSLELSFVQGVAAANGRERVELHKMAISSWEIVISGAQTSQECGLSKNKSSPEPISREFPGRMVRAPEYANYAAGA